jgi:bifunctional UDP-N-acetylglucosamine pyrophosphorylase/glucosamine-1-phosphate N-acetyltransferase
MRINYEYYFSNTEDFYIPDVFKDIKHPWDALINSKKVLKAVLTENNIHENNGETRGNVHFYDNFSIGKGTLIYNDVTILGPVIIGENCEIMPGATIRPGTIIGNNCSIGHGCEIKNSVIQNFAKIQSISFVGDSVIGKSARVGSGAITANRKFNQTNIILKTEDGALDTGTDFFGCILGDNSRIGANCVTQPGTLIGKYCWIYPMTSVRGFIPEAKRVYHKNPIVMEDNERIELNS